MLVVTTWVQNYISIYTKYGCGLVLIGMNPCDIGIFVFLFIQRWFEKKKAFSASEIVKKLKPISSSLPKNMRTSYSEKSARTSLTKLTTLGFVKECKNDKKSNKGGRPPTTLYETIPLFRIKENLFNIMDDYKQSVSEIMLPFETMEEGISMREGNSKVE